MHEAAKLQPVVIDESLIDLESLQLAREMGYTGVALKACKGQTQSLLLAAAAQKYGHVPVRAGPDLPGGVADPLGRAGGPRARRGGHRGERPAVLPGGERGVGGAVPRRVHHQRRDDEHRRCSPGRGSGRSADGQAAVKMSRRQGAGDTPRRLGDVSDSGRSTAP